MEVTIAVVAGREQNKNANYPSAADLGMHGSSSDPMLAGFPLINVTNYSALSFPANEPVQYYVTDWQFGDKFTWVKAKHILKWGIDYNRYQFNQPYFNNSRGTMTANGNWTGNGTAANGNAVGDLLLGLLNSSSLDTQNSRNYTREESTNLFFNDDFKISRSLTLNLGLRYELNTPAYDKFDRMTNFIPSLGKIVIASTNGVPNYQQLLQQTGLTNTMALASDYALPRGLVALATTLSTFSTIRYSVVGEAPTFFALRAPISGTGDPIRWLSVSPASGTVARPYLDVSIVTVQVDPGAVPPGENYGQIRVTADGAGNSLQNVTVLVVVRPPGSLLPPEVRPTGLIFTGLPGSNPPPQDFSISIPGLVDETAWHPIWPEIARSKIGALHCQPADPEIQSAPQGGLMRRSCWLWVLCLMVPAYGQTERGNITGQVKDPSGAAIPGAELMAIHLSTNVQTKTLTTPAGEYNITVPPGTYRVLVTAAGFKRYERENVTVATASTVRLDATLDLGTLSESVRVSTEVTQIQTETAKVSTAVPNRLVDELPLVVGGTLRSPFDLVTVAPEARGSGQTLVLGGGQAAAWNATLDGLSVTTNRSADTVEIAYLAPSVEAITEFTVDTNGFKAEYGQAGGGVMTFSSKSGTNAIHGSAYDFLRNDALDARGFFAPTRSVYKQNDFGATLGGPVYLPKIYNGRNRTFFFLSYEGFRNRAGNNGRIFSVPTPEMYQGDFSKWVNSAGNLLAIYDPGSTRSNPNGSGSIRDVFPGNRIPAARFSTFATQLLPYGAVVKPNRGAVPGTFAYVQNNFISTSGSVLSPQDKGSVKADHVIGNNHRLGFLFNITRYRQDPGADGPPGLPMPLWDGQASLFNTEVYRLSYDWTISPRMLNSFSIGGNKFLKESFSPNAGNDPVKGGNWESKLCMKNVVSCTVNFPQIAFTEAQGWGGSGYNGTLQPMWALKDDLSYTRGKHNFKLGYAYQWQFAAGIGEQLISGQAGFSFLGTSVPAATSFTSGSSFASFLLGWADSGGTDSKRYTPQIYGYHGFYAQDDWHVTPRLTLNLGLRYEFTRPPVNEVDEYTDFDPTRPNPAVNNYPGAIIFAGFGPGRENKRTLVPGWYGAIGPRFGLAYSPDGSKTTIRSAFGRSFSRVSVTSGSGHYEGFGISPRFNSPDQDITPAFQLDRGLPPYLLPPQINPAFQNNLAMDYWNGKDASRASENLYWTLSIQRQLTANTLIEAAYDATIGTHLQTGLLNINQTPTVYLNRFIQQYGAAGALNLLRADINSPLARSAGIPIPYPNFTDPTVQQFRTVAQALRPFPQFQTIATAAVGGGGIGAGNGDKSGHSSYHGLLIKAERRFSRGLTFQWNYTLSKILTDSDTYYTSNQAQDHYNRGLEKSIGQYDQTHSLKMSTLYELPIGKGKRFLSGAFAGRLLGGWRVAAIQSYASGFPLALSRNNPFPIFNGPTRPVITSYDGWRAPIAGGKFDPNVDKFLDRNVFPVQSSDQFGNVTRFTPKLRSFPLFNENVSLAKSFYFTERKRLDFRAEAFNLFNRTRFGNPSANLNASTFGVISSQANTPRQMQVALKLYW